MRGYGFNEMSLVVDESPSRGVPGQDRQLSAQAVEVRSPRTKREKWPFPLYSARSSIVKKEDVAAPDAPAGGGIIPENSVSDDTDASPKTQENTPGTRIVSPVPSLCQARSNALPIAGSSRYSHVEQTKLQGGVRNQGSHGDRCSNGGGTRDFRTNESPFSRRVKEKFEQIHAYGQESHSELSQPTAEPHTSAEIEAPPSHTEPLDIKDPSTRSVLHLDGDKSVRRIRPLYVGTAGPKLLMGPRKLNTAPAPGSVMDKVRMIEGRRLD
ncbi:hypothetical protein F5148DRAFT_992221 [Russula earlei]|uniref:Uncharacterized protein n=1 Tax=Russula earlei TaxID=71964 RepID=A0ACC0UN21_9AGAM|nr:hypothetical protein F5148DRAFT_992221 [Russula earlei]